jgi:5-methylcytosine-specific restriction endonuclease McrA
MDTDKKPVPAVVPAVTDPYGYVMRLFLGRCIMCNHVATEVNHIIPRSRGKEFKDDWKNMAPLCNTCHDAYHDGGVSDDKVKSMQNMRAFRLTNMRKEQYI